MKNLHIFFCFLSVLLIGINLLMLIDTDGRIWLVLSFILTLGFTFERDEPVTTTLLSFFWMMTLGAVTARNFQHPLEVSTGTFVFVCFGFVFMCFSFIHGFRSLINSTPRIGVQESAN
ncbi:MAG: hypothetical protein AAB447_02255 [Patescibacteria group bacterium]